MSGDTVNFPANDTQSSGLLQVQNTLTAFINKVATQLRHRGGHLAETKHKITAPTELNKVATQPNFWAETEYKITALSELQTPLPSPPPPQRFYSSYNEP